MGNTDFETIFNEFKRLHPNRHEHFNPTDANVLRWQWHIRNMQNTSAEPVTKVLRPTKKIDRAAAPRAVTRFDEFPAYMIGRWGEIASHFPGIQVWAAGSRVSGEYIEPWSSPEIAAWREANFKKPTKESDYDFYIDGKPTPVGDLPSWADWVRGRVDIKQRIQIPMWDFTKLPEEHHQKAIDMFLENDVRGLLDLHNQFQLSPYNYCCEMDGFLRWWSWAIEQRIINGVQKQTASQTDHQLD